MAPVSSSRVKRARSASCCSTPASAPCPSLPRPTGQDAEDEHVATLHQEEPPPPGRSRRRGCTSPGRRRSPSSGEPTGRCRVPASTRSMWMTVSSGASVDRLRGSPHRAEHDHIGLLEVGCVQRQDRRREGPTVPTSRMAAAAARRVRARASRSFLSPGRGPAQRQRLSRARRISSRTCGVPATLKAEPQDAGFQTWSRTLSPVATGTTPMPLPLSRISHTCSSVPARLPGRDRRVRRGGSGSGRRRSRSASPPASHEGAHLLTNEGLPASEAEDQPAPSVQVEHPGFEVGQPHPKTRLTLA